MIHHSRLIELTLNVLLINLGREFVALTGTPESMKGVPFVDYLSSNWRKPLLIQRRSSAILAAPHSTPHEKFSDAL